MTSDILNRSDTPIISVILPTYNRSKSLLSAIDSVIAQQFTRWELLISDDGSTDGSQRLVEELAAVDPRIKLIAGARGGVSAARNRAMVVAQGQIFCYLDSDNTWRPNYLQKIYEQLAGKVKACCYTALQAYILDAEDNVTRETVLLNDFDAAKIRRRNQIDLNTFAHSRDLFDAMGGFDESLSRLVDWDMILRYSKLAVPVKIPDICADYYHHQDENRVSVSQHYAINRFKISLKHDLYDGFDIVLAGVDVNDPLLADLAHRGLKYQLLDKAEVEQGWVPSASDIVIWRWTEWDEIPGKLGLASSVLDYKCAVSFYDIPDIGVVDQIARHGHDGRFHYVVVPNQADKTALQEKICSLRAVQEVNPIDRILLHESSAAPEYSFQHYVGLLQRYYYPADSTQKIAVGIQPLTTENPLEWGDYQYTQSFVAALQQQGFAADILCRDEWIKKLADYPIFIHIYGIHHPPMPAVKGQLRCLWIISHIDRFEPIKTAGFDYIFSASKKYVEYLRRVAPGVRVEYLPQATDIEKFFPLDAQSDRDLGFVGNSRGVNRPAVEYACASGRSFSVWGMGWDDKLPEGVLQSGLLASSEVAQVYNRSKVVVNDHWDDQRSWSLVNNRIFDVLACGKIPVSDKNDGLEDLFPFVPTFENQAEFNQAVSKAESLTDAMGTAAIRQTIVSAHSFNHRAQTVLARVGQLTNPLLGSGKRKFEQPRILYLCGNPNANSTRKRVTEVVEALSASSTIRMVEHKRATIYDMLGADIIVIQRWVDQNLDRTPALFDAIAQLRPLGKMFVYEIDDLLFHRGGGLPIRLMKSCDAVITSTDTLRRMALRYNSNVHLLANGVKVPETMVSAAQNAVPKVLSVSTDAMGFEDFRRLKDHFDQAGVDCEFIYVTQAKIGAQEAGKVTVMPAMSVERLHHLIGEVDIVFNDGALPEELITRLGLTSKNLSASDFVNSKSPLKYFYAGIAGKCFVTTSEPVAYTEQVTDRVTGFFADTFEDKVRVLGELFASPELREKVGLAAKADIMAQHTLIARTLDYTAMFDELNERRLNCQHHLLVFYHGLNDLDPSDVVSAIDQSLLAQMSAMKNAIDGQKVSTKEITNNAKLSEQSLLTQISAMKNTIEGYKLNAKQAVEDVKARMAIETDVKFTNAQKKPTNALRAKWFLFKRKTYLQLVYLAKKNRTLESVSRKIWNMYQNTKQR